ncbi:MAG: hypothetical protein ACON38_09555 [Akkermansiaceae bacterium]
MNPERVFQTLSAIGLIAGGWFYGEYWKSTVRFGATSEELAELRARNTALTLQLDEREDELAQVRSMLTKGPFAVPEDLIAWVEQDFGMVFLKPPKVRLATPDDLRNAAERNLRLIHGDNGLDLENRAWELVGLLPEGHRLLAQWMMLESSGVRGIFDLEKEEVLLAETYDPDSIPDSGVLARLLARQLAYQNHPRTTWGNRDQWQAWQATHIGAAASLQSRYLRRQSASNEAEFKDPETEREELLMTLSPALQGFANFPFVEGNDYARSFYIKSREAWGAMFRNPPTNTASIIYPEKPVETEDKITLEPPGNVIGENNLGMLGLRLWLEPFLGTEVASELADTWKNDLYQLSGDPERPALTWVIELTDQAAVQKLIEEVRQSMMDHLAETQPGRAIELKSDGSRFIFQNNP